jgi:RHS repeat-associated protein
VGPNGAGGDPSPFTAQQISLPKGGGAIRGIDEKFTANPVTGTGSLNVPLAVSPGRSGFGPQLSVNYDSGMGNGIFGFGWNLSLPSITRRTDKGLPQYRDGEESDIFVLTGAEDLVPVLARDENGETRRDEFERDGYRIRRYRPRVEGLFARIERWTRLDTGEAHWRSLSKNNILTVYGLDSGSRIADPEAPEHVFSWLICRSYDDTGNAIVYNYAAQNDSGIDCAKPSERNRVRTANRYPKRIRYGNRVPLLLNPDTPSFRCSHIAAHDLDAARWMFEVVFDYGEGHYRDEAPDEEGRVLSHASAEADAGSWPVRRDPFSSYRSGFEIRTYRLCRRVLMFHHFPEELGVECCLVRSTAFSYRETTLGSFIERVVQSGHKRREDGSYLTRSLPPLDLFYTASPLEDPDFQDYRLEDVDPDSLSNLPSGIDGGDYRLLDLDGEGISGVLTEQDSAWFYKPNLGGGRFGAMETVREQPSLAALDSGRQQLMDVAGDGNLDLVDLSPPAPGFYERTLDAGWAGFRPFRSLPVRDWSDPNLRFVDLTGDGIADVLITEDDAFTWHPSLLQEGFGTGRRVPVPLEEGQGPHVVFADGAQSIYLADMSGDGLSDLVRIRNGEACYWPNRGYGRFGAKVTMDNAPWFDEPDLFDQGRIRLADTDGSGTTDILYLGHDGVRVYLNETGNGWSDARHLRRFPAIDNVGAVVVADVLGRGTACLLWSSPLPADAGTRLRYVDLMCGEKPHLLNRSVNNLGAETRIGYASSTKFHLADKAAGTPWVTRLPFPVHVVERVETYDHISRNRFVTRYSYHHGFYDGVEREFRGFGRVDQIDTEAFAALTASGHFPVGHNIDAASNVPPVLTKTWFHTGVYLAGGRVSRHLAHEYYQEGSARRGEARLSGEQVCAMLLDDTILPDHLTPEEAREACRSLKGAMLRQEIYALDGKEESSRPYSVSESNFTIRTLQKRKMNRHAVFFTHPREQVGFHYERKLYDIDGCRRFDPRVSHGVTLEVDDYGNVLKSVAIGYGRRFPDSSPLLTDEDREKQAQLLLTLTESDYTNAVEAADAYRTPLLAEQRLLELVKVTPDADLPGITNLFRFREIARKVAQASDGSHDLPFEDWQAIGAVEHAPYRRLLKKSRTLYRANHLRHLLPLGALEALALPGQSYKLAFTRGLLTQVYRRGEPSVDLLPDRARVLRDEGGYADLDEDGHWWVPSGRMFYSPQEGEGAADELAYALRHYFLAHRYRDVFGNVTRVAFDRHDLVPVETMDAVGNIIQTELDYRVLSPRLLTDPNGNRSQVAFDARGLVAGTAVMGKIGENLGDSLEGFEPDLGLTQMQAFLADPRGSALDLLGNASTRIVYDVERFLISEAPVFAATIARETHVSDLRPGERSRTQVGLSYSDGFGREIQKKLQAEPGPFVDEGPGVDPRWIGSGWTIFNNKGQPIRQYEPFFSASHDFEFAVITGVSPILFYDPVGRVVATLRPNKTYEKVVFDPWRQTSWDVNDTVLLDPKTDPDVGEFFARILDSDYLPTWYQQRIDGAKGVAEKSAAEKAAKHAMTPTMANFDSLGRAFLTIADNGNDETGKPRKYATRALLDIQTNRRAVIDALDRVVMRYEYDMRGIGLHQASMEAGERWMLIDVAGKPIRAWNSRLYDFRTEYDALRRQIRSFVRGGDPYERNAKTYPREILFDQTIYGDSVDAGLTEHRRLAANLRCKILRHFDAAGMLTTDRYDFKGNLSNSYRRFAKEYKDIADWSQDPALETESFVGSATYDGLNRTVTMTTPDSSVYRPAYNESAQVKQIGVQLRGQVIWTPFVTDIDYNARGQPTRITYGNGASTTYDYDEKTFRLQRLQTERSLDRDALATKIFAHNAAIQDLHYTYDPVGNITEVADVSLRTVYHDNHRVDPVCRYTYDALYRLIKATGRENIGQSALQFTPPDGDYRDYPFVGAARLGDLHALRNYAEQYEYDAVGNIKRMAHLAEKVNWTRIYTYQENSLIEPARRNNRLSGTHLNTNGNPVLERCLYDNHGNVTQLPHLPLMAWDFMDQLRASSRQIVNTGMPETTFYSYDVTGQRVRKVSCRSNGTRKSERLYVGGFEIYMEYDGLGENATLQRETLHIVDETRRIALVETLTMDRERALTASEPLLRYQLPNHLGSASLELDNVAALISYEEYAPYGSTAYQAGRSAAEVKRKRYRHTGKERDEENGFSYHGARYYAPWLGRWITADPGGIAGGLNLYMYVSANPIVSTDSTGYDDDKIIDQSNEYGGTLPPGGTPEPPAAGADQAPSSPAEPSNVYPADFIGPLPEGATRDPGPTPDAGPSPPTAAPSPPAQEQANPSGGEPATAAATRTQRYQAILEQQNKRDFWDDPFHKNTPEEVAANQWLSAHGCPECDLDAPPEELARQLQAHRFGVGLINLNNAVVLHMASSPGAPEDLGSEAHMGVSNSTPKTSFLENDVEVAYGENYTRIGNDPATVRVTAARKPWPGTHDVVVQAESEGGRFSPGVRTSGKPLYVETHEAQIAEALNQNPGLAPGQPIRALSCALSPEQAQALADLTQRPVFASPLVVGVRNGPGTLPIEQFIRYDFAAGQFTGFAEKQVWFLYLPRTQ